MFLVNDMYQEHVL